MAHFPNMYSVLANIRFTGYHETLTPYYMQGLINELRSKEEANLSTIETQRRQLSNQQEHQENWNESPPPAGSARLTQAAPVVTGQQHTGFSFNWTLAHTFREQTYTCRHIHSAVIFRAVSSV